MALGAALTQRGLGRKSLIVPGNALSNAAFAAAAFAESPQELNSEIWGKGVCDIWEKWVSG